MSGVQVSPPLRARHASLCGGTATDTDGDRAWASKLAAKLQLKIY